MYVISVYCLLSVMICVWIKVIIHEKDQVQNHNDRHTSICVLQVDKKYAEAYYQRGLCKVKLKLSKGIQDFNRALALRPKLFEVRIINSTITHHCKFTC